MFTKTISLEIVLRITILDKGGYLLPEFTRLCICPTGIPFREQKLLSGILAAMFGYGTMNDIPVQRMALY